ncbi:TKL protein kinase [Phytophthora cinnamomi]|uniref:TKL protein kinase n=1 Tax=Phytophthora cinnamomi TaxID=4785 RepID=UPI003559663E|nr:TKL protein kinase [Phytophthora cinnamomi]
MPLFRKKSRSSSSSSSSGTIDFSELKLGKVVGAGRSGSTFSARWNGRLVAAKVVDLSAQKPELARELLREFRREEEVAGALRHPNVVQFLGTASASPRHCLVFEFMEGGTLAELLRRSKKAPLDFFRLAADMAQGMGYLHEHSVMHRDLKSSNVLLDARGSAKISDFGLSCVMELGRAADFTAETGTYGWMAPEVIRHEPYSSKADVYSFAVVLWELLAREVPFKGQTPMQTAMAVAEQRMRPALPRQTPPKIAELIEHCWNQDPTRRPDFSSILKVLPFVKQSLSKTDFKNASILYTAD